MVWFADQNSDHDLLPNYYRHYARVSCSSAVPIRCAMASDVGHYAVDFGYSLIGETLVPIRGKNTHDDLLPGTTT